jgi:hypothetical protein
VKATRVGTMMHHSRRNDGRGKESKKMMKKLGAEKRVDRRLLGEIRSELEKF